jgi:hypothetical protein
MKSPAPKQRYRGPEVVDMGDVAATTTNMGAPVRDNPGIDPPTYYNANPPEGAAHDEVDLGDR